MSQDRHLQEAVLAEFAWEPSINAAHIGVIVDAGIVTLTGHVSNYLEKRSATDAATRVKGVKGVVQQMEVRLHSSAERSDEEIARVAIDHLIWNVSVPANAIKVQVEKGWVTLSGEVEWHFQQEAAELAVRGLYGVVGISDRTTIKPKPDAVNISADINTALHRSWFDPDKVKVTASGGKVKLTGTVHSSSERWTAGSTAWGSPGATSVENDLIVA